MRTLALSLAIAWTGALRAHPEIDDALSRLNPLIAEAPGNAELYLERGELYARHEDWVAAESNYLRAAELSPQLPGLARDRGVLELAAGRPAQARTFLDRAIAVDPADAEALILRARAQAKLGARAAALSDLNAALARLGAPSPDLFLERASLIASPADAIRSLDEGLARLGPVLSLQLRALALEESLGRIDAALARLDQIAVRDESKAPWLKRRGDLLARAGRKREARAAYTAALADIAALPEWLRTSPPTLSLATELKQLTLPASS